MAVFLLAGGVSSYARDAGGGTGGTVTYTPSSKILEGVTPWTASYVLTISAPANLVSAENVTLDVSVASDPLNNAPLARSFLQLSQSSLTFTSPGQSLSVTVTMTMPSFPGITADLTFAYAIKAVGWTVPIDINNPATINAIASAPPATGAPPVVSISTPTIGQIFTYDVSQLPAVIPLDFQVVSGAGLPITSLDATVNGEPLSVTLPVDATSISQSVSMTISAAGTYTAIVRAANQVDSANDSHQFTVNVSGPPPSIVVDLPADNTDFTYFVGSPPVVVPNHFTATTPAGTLKSWKATLTTPPVGELVDLAITPFSPGGKTASGSTALSLTTPGRYVLGVSVANQYGSASDSTSFWINRVTNPTDQTVFAFESATFNVTATLRADSNYTYRWYRQAAGTTGYVALSDSGPYSGTSTLTLNVSGATGAMSGDLFKLAIIRNHGGTIETTPARLTVNKLTPLIAWPTPLPIIYGTALSGAQLNATVNAAGTLTYSPSSGVLGAGNRTLNVSFAPSDPVNYNSASASVVLNVVKAVLNVTADDKTKVYGSANPALTYQIAGFVNGETLSNSGVTGAPALATAATLTSGVAGSPYAITVAPGTLSAANYSFAFVIGQLAVTPAPLTIKANDKTMVQGDVVPALDVTYLVLLNGDGPGVVTGLALQTTATSASLPGTYPITVSGGTAANYSISRQNGILTVTPNSGTHVTITGVVFFDANFNGVRETGEPGLGGVGVRLLSGTTVVATTATAANGEYLFNQASGTYTVSVSDAVAGLSPTTANLDQTREFTTPSSTVDPVGFGLNWSQIRGLKSAALSQGFWKNNVNKAQAKKPNGYQVAPETVAAYTTQIGSLALAPYAGLTMPQASAIFSGKSQLELQLLAAEYNYVSGAWINGSQALTLAFITWGETVLQNTGNVYNRSYQTFAASWFEAYNTSEGGYVFGPLP